MLIHDAPPGRRRHRRASSAAAVLAVSFALACASTLVTSSPTTAQTPVGTGRQFVAVQGRVLDTRAASQVGAYKTPMAARSWRAVAVAGAAGVPLTGASAVLVTLTVVAPTSGGVVHADQDDDQPPDVATPYVNYVARKTVSNSAVIALGDGGRVRLETTSSTHLIMDVQGYYTSGNPVAGGYVSLKPTRIVDTRNGTGLPKAVLRSGTTAAMPGLRNAGVPARASAVMVNVTVLSTSSTGGFLVVYPAGTRPPATSLNFGAAATAIGAQVALGATAGTTATAGTPTSAGTTFDVAVHGTSVNLLVDVVGYLAVQPGAGAFTATAKRVYDSRVSPAAPIAAGATVAVPVAGVGDIPPAEDGTIAVVTHTAVINTGAQAGVLRIWPDGTREPTQTSSVNFTAGVTGNMITTGLGTDGAIMVRNLGQQPIHLVVDVQGWYATDPPARAEGRISGLDMHDGTITEADGTYYMYGTQYACGYTWFVADTPFCGFAVRTARSLDGPWSVPRLLFSPTAHAHTTGANWAGDNAKTWNWICGRHGAGCFNPRMLHRPDGVWVLWFNAPGDYFRTKTNAYWAMGCNGPAGPCGSSAGAPYGTDHKPNLSQCADDGDFSVLTAGGTAAVLCSQGRISEEKLTWSWVDGTGVGTRNITLTGVPGAEGVGGRQRPDGTWEMTYATPPCGYCSGTSAAGGAATQVQTGYATAPTMLGPWTAHGLLGQDHCVGQPRTVVTDTNGAAYEWIDRWTGDRNETDAAITLEPLDAVPWTCA